MLDQIEKESNSNSESMNKIKEGLVETMSNFFFYKTVKLILYNDCKIEVLEGNDLKPSVIVLIIFYLYFICIFSLYCYLKKIVLLF